MLSTISTQIESLVLRPASNLEDLLAGLVSTNGGRTELNSEVQVYDLLNFNGYSGFNYWIGNDLIGQLYIANLEKGGFVIYKRVYSNGNLTETNDIYNAEGIYQYSLPELNQALITYPLINMEIDSPILNHLYNILHLEYGKASTGTIHTKEILFIERFLQKLEKKETLTIGVNKVSSDLALINIKNTIYRYEDDPVLRWTERQEVYKGLKEIKKKITETKKRAHKLSFLKYNFLLYLDDLRTSFNLFRKRPGNNFKGLLYKNTLGNLFWFIDMVKSNLGYSIALAIYGPFTFYFITQPMNPHAMWAVGKVRDAYLDVVDKVETLSNEIIIAKDSNQNMVEDKVATNEASTQKPAEPLKITESKETWEDRMSNFKAMQIGYEGELVFAARLGRIEQLENQYNFPLTAESLWHEIKRYENGLKSSLAFNTNLDIRFKNFLNKELKRNNDYKVWLLERLSQFFLDHPYIVVDQNNEQTQKSIYTSVGFSLLKEIADELKNEKVIETLPPTHKKVFELATNFEKSRIEKPTISESLKANSKLFGSNDVYNTESFRDYMKRHWEILFLQQNKKQEASSFGLQAYTWSVRNALWIMQTIISAKREELPTLTYKYNLDNQGTSEVSAQKSTTRLYESMLEFLVSEFTGVKKEIALYLKDNEIDRRKRLIEEVWNSLDERDELFNNFSGQKRNQTAKN